MLGTDKNYKKKLIIIKIFKMKTLISTLGICINLIATFHYMLVK